MATAIAEIIINGIVFDLKNWRSGMSNLDNFVEVIDNLFNILVQRNIDYLLVGGVALLSYIEGRNTQDIDLILSSSALESLSEITILERNNNFARGNFSGLQVDILLTQNNLFDLILQQFASVQQFGERSIRCVSVEGLVILKFYALPSLYRQGKFDRVSIYENDILLLRLQYSVNLKPIFQILSEHLLSSDLETVQEIAVEIEAKVKRFVAQKKRLEEG